MLMQHIVDDTSQVIIGNPSTTFVVTTKYFLSTALFQAYNDNLVNPQLGSFNCTRSH